MAIKVINAGKAGHALTDLTLIRGDSRTQTVRFCVQKNHGGVDLSTLAWSVTVENAAGATDEYVPENIAVDGNVIRMDWIVGGTATAAAGLTKFKLSGYMQNGETLIWQSGTYLIRVNDTIEYIPGSEEEAAISAVQQLIVYVEGELNNVIAAGNAASAAAGAASTAAADAASAAESASTAATAANAAATSANTAAESANTAAGYANDAAGILTDEFKGVVDRLTSPFETEGSIVACHPVEGYPLGVKTVLAPAQSGSGDPYPDNIRPIIGHTGAKLTRCGKNLLVIPNIDGWTSNGVTWSSENGAVKAVGTANGDSYTNTTSSDAPKGELTLPNGFYKTAGWTSKIQVIARVAESGNVTQYSNGTVFTVDDNTESVRIFFYTKTGSVVDETFYPMLVRSEETDLTYEPYQGDTVTVNFGQSVYGGTLDWNTGVLTVDRLCVTSAQASNILSMRTYVTKTNTVQFRMYFGNKNIPYTTVVSNVFPDVKNNWNTDRISCSAVVDSSIDVAVPKTFLSKYGFDDGADYNSDVTAFRAWLADVVATGTPVQFCYELAEPTVIQLTPQQILALKGKNTLFSDPGETTVSGRIDPEWLNEQFKNAIISLGGNI